MNPSELKIDLLTVVIKSLLENGVKSNFIDTALVECLNKNLIESSEYETLVEAFEL